MAEIQRDLTRVVLAVIFILALIGSSIWILRPFLGAMVWATSIVVATWPLMIKVQDWLWGKRSLAVTVMALLLLCILIVPLTFAIGTIVSNVDDIANGQNQWLPSRRLRHGVVASVPLIGAKAVELLALRGGPRVDEIGSRAAPYAGSVIKWFATQVAALASCSWNFC